MQRNLTDPTPQHLESMSIPVLKIMSNPNKKNKPWAQSELAFRYQSNDSFSPSSSQASSSKWNCFVNDEGKLEAQRSVGGCYEKGVYKVHRPMEQAQHWYELSAAQGNKLAIENLQKLNAKKHLSSLVYKKNKKKKKKKKKQPPVSPPSTEEIYSMSLKTLKRFCNKKKTTAAAAAAASWSENEMARRYYYGEGDGVNHVKRSSKKAFVWYMEAAQVRKTLPIGTKIAQFLYSPCIWSKNKS